MTKILCTICARGGSKGVPRKNIRNVHGKPLIAYSIEHALEWRRADDVIVSTDDMDIQEIAIEYGAQVPFERPGHLATDDAAKIPVIQHATTKMEEKLDKRYDYVVDIDPTAPLRVVQDIEDCFQIVTEEDVSNVYTVTEADKNPYFNMVELDAEGYAQLSKRLDADVVRRQEAPTVYAMNASVYAYSRDFLQNTESVHSELTKISEMPPERSVDIDTMFDLKFVEYLMEANHA